MHLRPVSYLMELQRRGGRMRLWTTRVGTYAPGSLLHQLPRSVTSRGSTEASLVCRRPGLVERPRWVLVLSERRAFEVLDQFAHGAVSVGASYSPAEVRGASTAP